MLWGDSFLRFQFAFLIFSGTDLFSCDFFSRVSSCYLLIQLPVTQPCFKFFSDDHPLDVCWDQQFLTFRPFGLENTQCPSAQLFKLLLQKMATRRQHYSASHIPRPPPRRASPIFVWFFSWSRGDFWFYVCFKCTGTWFINVWALIYSLSSSCSLLGDYTIQ